MALSELSYLIHLRSTYSKVHHVDKTLSNFNPPFVTRINDLKQQNLLPFRRNSNLTVHDTRSVKPVQRHLQMDKSGCQCTAA